MQIAQYLAMIRENEKQLAEAFLMVSDKHDRDSEIHNMCQQLAAWSNAHIKELDPFVEKYGEDKSKNQQVEQVRGALFHGTRIGGAGLMADLQDLMTLASIAVIKWTILEQGATALHDKALATVAEEACKQGDRQVSWLRTELKTAAPQALTVDPEKPSSIAASLPRIEKPTNMQELAWGPIVSGILMLIVGVVGLAVGRPWLFPSLGPTAYLQAESPSNPASRFYNTVIGHFVGIAAGLAGIGIFHAWNDPVVLKAQQLTAGRVGASAVALGLTLLLALALKASHPPAGATTLLVALGTFQTADAVLNVVAGVIIVAVAGELLRRARLGELSMRPERKEERLPAPKAHP